MTDETDLAKISEMPGASLSVVERVCKMKANIFADQYISPINKYSHRR